MIKSKEHDYLFKSIASLKGVGLKTKLLLRQKKD